MSDYSQRPRQRLLRTIGTKKPPGESLHFLTVFDHQRLFQIFCDLKSNPRCAGLDGYTFGDLSLPEGAEICRRLVRQIDDETYVPGPTLHCEIQKFSGGTRTLQIPEIMDHLVARAAHEAISPFAERLFCNQSYGFRPGRTAWHMLAVVVRHLQVSRRPYFAAYDITKAFDQVRLEPILEGFGRLFGEVDYAYGSTRWPRLLKMILGGAAVPRKGIGQGNPLSPLALNIGLHYAADVHFVDAGTAWWRFADNIFFSGRSLSGLSDSKDELSTWLSPLDVSLHGRQGNFRDGFVPSILGFDVSLRNKVPHFAISRSAWCKLEADLAEVHRYADPPKVLEDQLVGWISAQGPALSSLVAVFNRIMESAQRATGLTPAGDTLQRQALSARRKWERLLRRVLLRR